MRTGGGAAGGGQLERPCPGVLGVSRPGASIQFICTESPSPPCMAHLGQNPDPRPLRGKREGCQEVGPRAVFLGDPGLVLCPPPKMSITASGLRGRFLGSQSPALLSFLGSGPFLFATQSCCEDLGQGSGQAKAPAVAKGPVSCLRRNVLSERERRWGAAQWGRGSEEVRFVPASWFQVAGTGSCRLSGKGTFNTSPR